MVDVPIHTPTIRLGQLLKLAGVIGTGAEVKALLGGESAASGESAVHVNGEPETRRGRQLRPGDVVVVAGGGAGDDVELRIVSDPATG